MEERKEMKEKEIPKGVVKRLLVVVVVLLLLCCGLFNSVVQLCLYLVQRQVVCGAEKTVEWASGRTQGVMFLLNGCGVVEVE
jgi:hypothetical protein